MTNKAIFVTQTFLGKVSNPQHPGPSMIYRWDPDLRRFTFYQWIKTSGATDGTFFRISFNPKVIFNCLVVANSFNGVTSLVESVIYCWEFSSKNRQFEEAQRIQVRIFRGTWFLPRGAGEGYSSCYPTPISRQWHGAQLSGKSRRPRPELIVSAFFVVTCSGKEKWNKRLLVKGDKEQLLIFVRFWAFPKQILKSLSPSNQLLPGSRLNSL